MPIKQHIDLFEEFRAGIRSAFINAILTKCTAVEIDELERLIRDGNIEGAVAILRLDNAIIDDVIEEVRIAYRKHGTLYVEELKPPPDIRRARSAAFTFELLGNPRAEQWLIEESSNLIVEVVEQQRQMARSLIAENVVRANNPRDVAIQLVGRYNRNTRKRHGGVIGLTENQERWVSNTEAELRRGDYNSYLARKLRDKRYDSTVRKHRKAKTAIPTKTIDKMVLAYQSRALRYRGEVIGRTESLRAMNVAHMHALEGVIEKGGIVNRQNAKREWNATLGSPRTRDTHIAVHGQVRGIDETWTVGNSELRYPGDPQGEAKEVIQCRCVTISRVDWLAEAEF